MEELQHRRDFQSHFDCQDLTLDDLNKKGNLDHE